MFEFSKICWPRQRPRDGEVRAAVDAVGLHVTRDRQALPHDALAPLWREGDCGVREIVHHLDEIPALAKVDLVDVRDDLERRSVRRPLELVQDAREHHQVVEHHAESDVERQVLLYIRLLKYARQK